MRFYLRALRYFATDWWLVGLWLATIGLSIGVGLLYSWPTAVLIDTVFSTHATHGFMHRLFLAPLPEEPLARVFGLTIIGMLLKAAGDALSLARKMLAGRVNLAGLARARCELYDKLASLGMGYHKRQAQGDAIYRVHADTEGLRVILNVLVDAAVAAVTLVAMTGIMLSTHGTLTLIALAVAPALVATNGYFGPRIKRRTTEAKEADARFTTILQRSMSAVAVVQAFGRQADESARFHDAARGSARAWLRQVWQDSLYWLVVACIFSLGGAVIFGYGGYLAYRDQVVSPVADGMTFGFVLVFMAYLGQLWDPLAKLTGVGATIKPGVAGAERVFQVLDTPTDLPEDPDARPLPLAPRTIALGGARFAYTPGQPVLRAVTAAVAPGEFVAFVGPSGAGKSTLLSLLPRFYDPTAGAVTLDGRDLRTLRPSDVRRHVACVPQDSPLLPVSVADNIAYGRPTATAMEVRSAAHLAGASDFIEALPDGYDTLVAENGANFSGGQRQRIAIARALLTDAPILVLDEPTSALDGEHERRITDLLDSLRGKRTVILVTHRLASVAGCDRIYVLNQGVIAEEGTHHALLAHGGLYAAMHRLETAGPPKPGLAA